MLTLVLWRRRACAFSRDRRLALHVCYRQVQADSGVKKEVRKHALPTFLNFGFVWQMKDFVTGDVRKR